MALLLDSKNIFIVGIRGVAMTGIAKILIQSGKKVEGSDTQEMQITDQLLDSLSIHISQLDDKLPDDIDLLIYSAANGGKTNPQVVEAQLRGIMIVSQATFIAEFLKQFPVSIAICGCHGKTGTTSLIAYILTQLGVKVSWLIGAPYFKGKEDGKPSNIITYPGANYDQDSKIFVFEADEYGVSPPQDMTPKLLLYYPTHIICTNIDFDHPDIYKDKMHVSQVFHQFFTHSSHLYECNSHSLNENLNGVISCLSELGYDRKTIQEIAKQFIGVARRMEYHGNSKGVDYYDDYGHHPAEIEVTISELRIKYPNRRLILLFQSHTYSRTQAFKNEFVETLSKADMVLIDTIFPSAREKMGVIPISALELETLAKTKGLSNIKGFETRSSLIDYAKSIITAGDVVMTIGAGDIYKVINTLKDSK